MLRRLTPDSQAIIKPECKKKIGLNPCRNILKGRRCVANRTLLYSAVHILSAYLLKVRLNSEGRANFATFEMALGIIKFLDDTTHVDGNTALNVAQCEL